MTDSVNYIYRIIDKFSPALEKINAANKRFLSGMGKARAGLQQFGAKTANLQNSLAALGAGAGLALVSKKAMDFEDVMTDVNKVVNFASNEQFVGFRENILKTSVALGKVPANLAEIAVAGGKLGIPVEDMDNFIGVVARTSVAFDMLEKDAGEQLGSIQAKLGMTVNDTADLMDAVNFLADNTAAAGNHMIEIIARTSGELKTIEMPRKFMAAWASFADQMETSPELAASGLNMMVRRIAKMPGMAAQLVKAPQETITSVLTALSKLDKVKQITTIEKMFGPEAARFVKKAVANMDKYRDTMAKVSDETLFAGSMQRELNKKLATASTAWGKMKATMDVVAITLGDVLLPYIKEIAPRVIKAGFAFREWAKAHPEIVKLGLAVTAMVAALMPVLVVAGIMATAIAAIISPAGLVVLAIAAIGAAIYEVWANWDKITKWFSEGLTSLRDGFIQTFDDISKAFNFVWNNIKKNVGGKIMSFIGLGGEPGVAAQNTIASQSTLNGNITVSAAEGSKVESAGLRTDVPGNLGFNMAGAMQ